MEEQGGILGEVSRTVYDVNVWLARLNVRIDRANAKLQGVNKERAAAEPAKAPYALLKRVILLEQIAEPAL
jgi:hypothetical protein